MHPAKLMAALALAALAPAPTLAADAEKAPAVADVAPVPGGTLPGVYAVNGDTSDVLIVEQIDARTFRMRHPGQWEGVGVFDGRVLFGAFRYGKESSETHLAGSTAGFRAVANAEGGFEVQGAFVQGWSGRFTATWERMADPAPTSGTTPSPAAEPASTPAPTSPPDTKH